MQSSFEESVQSIFNLVASESVNALGGIYYFLSDYPNAIDAYNQALRMNETSESAYYGRGVVRRSQADFIGAIADFSQVISLNPQNVYTYALRAACHRQLGNHADAIADYEQALQLHPTYVGICFDLGAARASSGDLEGAEREFARYAQVYPTAASYYNLGVMQQLLGLNSQALTSLTTAIRHGWETDNTHLYYMRSVINRSLGDDAAARSDFDYAASLETPGSGNFYPNDEHAYYFRGVARYYFGNREEAIADLQRSISIAELNCNQALMEKMQAVIQEFQTEAESESES
jgi:tetratricopeptide (TPR) repeat protein